MSRIDIDTYYMQIAFTAMSRAGCPSRKVGAIIVDKNNRILASGYNSPPRDLPTCLDVYCGKGVNDAPCIAAHAEISAITSCRDLQNAETIYITCSPCIDCTKAIMTTNIKRIVFAEYHKTWPKSRSIWTDQWTYMKDFAEEVRDAKKS